MKNLFVEVRAIRRCDGGHTCSLAANGTKVAFIAPGILEWTRFAVRVDVLNWFAARKGIKPSEFKPKELKDNWESKEPDHKSDTQDDKIEAMLLEWIKLHFKAYDALQACKKSVITVGNHGELLDWGVSPKSYRDATLQAAMTRYSAKMLNGMTLSEVVKLLEARLDSKRLTETIKIEG